MEGILRKKENGLAARVMRLKNTIPTSLLPFCYIFLKIKEYLLFRELMLSNNYLRALPYELGKLFQLQVFRMFIQGCTFLNKLFRINLFPTEKECFRCFLPLNSGNEKIFSNIKI